MATTATASAPDSASRWVVADGREAYQVEFEEGLVTFFVDTADLLGVPKSVAAIYGLMLASVEPLSFSEISARLNFSNGSVSQGLKVLREMGAVKEAAPNSQHKARSLQCFEPDLEMRKLMQRFIEQRLEAQLARSDESLTALEQTAENFPPADRKQIDQRLSKLRRWHTRARTMVPLVKAALKLPVP